MNIAMARRFILWCTVINYGMLVSWAVLYRFARDWSLRYAGRWIRISPEQFDILNAAGMTLD